MDWKINNQIERASRISYTACFGFAINAINAYGKTGTPESVIGLAKKFNNWCTKKALSYNSISKMESMSITAQASLNRAVESITMLDLKRSDDILATAEIYFNSINEITPKIKQQWVSIIEQQNQ